MPLVSSYTEATLAAYIVGGSRAAVAGLMGWTAGSDGIQEAVSRVERVLGVTDIVTETNMVTLEAVARLIFWRGAKAWLMTAYDITTDGQTLKRDQFWQHVGEMLLDAVGECEALGIPGVGGSGTVYQHPVEWDNDAYALSVLTGAEF